MATTFTPLEELPASGTLADQETKTAAGTLARFFRGRENPGKRALAHAAWVLYGRAMELMPDDPPALTIWDANSDKATALVMDELAQGGPLDWQKTMRIAKHMFALVA